MCAVAIFGCSREAWHAPMTTANDTLPLLPHLQAKKITITGPVNFITQLGTGNSTTAAATNNNKAGQRQGTAATGDASSATSKHNDTAWWVYGLFVISGIILGFWARNSLPSLGILSRIG